MSGWLAVVLILVALWLGHKGGRLSGYARGFLDGYQTAEAETQDAGPSVFVNHQREAAPWQ